MADAFNTFLKRAGYPAMTPPAETHDIDDVKAKLSALETEYQDFLPTDADDTAEDPEGTEATTEPEGDGEGALDGDDR